MDHLRLEKQLIAYRREEGWMSKRYLLSTTKKVGINGGSPCLPLAGDVLFGISIGSLAAPSSLGPRSKPQH